MGNENTSTSTKESILRAAFEVFLEKGMHGAGTQLIADRAGVNKAMLYYYFDSKEDLFVEVYRRTIDESGIKSVKILEEEIPLFEKIRRCIDRITDRLIKHPAIFAFLMNELNRQPGLLKDVLARELEFDVTSLSRQLSVSADRYEVARVEVGHLLANIITLCMGPVMNGTFYSILLNVEEDQTEFLEERKGVVYDMLISWLTT